jgi:rod shape determining protein RodA
VPVGEPDTAARARRGGLDWILLSAVAGLSVVGVVLVWSASRAALLQAGADPLTFAKKQLTYVVVGLVLLVAVALGGERIRGDKPGRTALRAWAPVAYAAAIVGLLAVLSPLGATINGARAWIALPGGFQAEPSEFAKLALVLIMARILAGADREGAAPGVCAVAIALACAALAIALVAAEPALGVTALLTVITASVVVLSGIRLRWLAALGGAAAITALAAWRLHLLRPYQLHRLAAFVHPGTDPAGAGYSATQSTIAVGSGRVLGQGLLHGQLIAGSFVPEPHTDFIFAAAGEELGFAGAVAIIALLTIIIVRALVIAGRAADRFDRLVAAGIAVWFAVQSFVNVGMALGIVPVTGLPLPFVSYGGSALLADMLAIGALQAIYRRQPIGGPRVSDAGAVRAGWKHSGTWRPPRC